MSEEGTAPCAMCRQRMPYGELWMPMGRPLCRDVDACARRMDVGGPDLVGVPHAMLVIRRAVAVLNEDLRDLDPKVDTVIHRLVHAIVVLMEEHQASVEIARDIIGPAERERPSLVRRVEALEEKARQTAALLTAHGITSSDDVDTQVIPMVRDDCADGVRHVWRDLGGGKVGCQRCGLVE